MSAGFGRRTLLGGAAIAPTLLGRAFASTEPPDIDRYVYIPSADSDRISVVEIQSNRIVNALQSGVVPAQAVLSRNAAALVLADANAASLSLVDVFTGARRMVSLPMRAERLTVSTDGARVAASETLSGTIAIVDLDAGRVTQIIAALAGLHDVMFGRNDTVLYFGAAGLDGIGVIALDTGQVAERIDAGGSVRALARMPDGRRLLAEVAEAIAVINAADGTLLASLTAGPDSAGMYPSALGNHLLVPDNARATLSVFRSAQGSGSVLPGAGAVTGVYCTWLDSVAFMPSASERSVRIYDLDKMRPAESLPLPGAPCRGAVTADTRTLYLPIGNASCLLAIDGATRRVAASIELPSSPLSALIAGGSGLCH